MTRELRHMSRAGKTFYFASFWLEKGVRRNVALVYSFCRCVDDIADEQQPGPERTAALDGIVSALEQHDSSHPVAGPMVSLIDDFPALYHPTIDLVRSCAADGPTIRIETERDLIDYSHGVAGNVGLMMYPLLSGEDPRGLPLADQLGIAMQCTNIARDVLADLRQGRVYLPRTWLGMEDVRGLLTGDPRTEAAAVRAVGQVLRVGREHYRRGLEGLRYLNPRARFAIRVAADCYAAIGERVIRDGKLVRERAVVPLRTKVLLAVRALQGWRHVEA
jgi:phytoene synthase